MFLYFAFALHIFATEFSPEQLFDSVADYDPNMAEFDLVFVGEECIQNRPSQIEHILRSVFTGGVTVANPDDSVAKVDIVIDDLEKIGAIPGLFSSCTVEIRNVERVFSEILPTPNHILDDLSDIMEEVDDQTFSEARRNLVNDELPEEMSFKDNIGVARAQTGLTCAAFVAASVTEIHENIEWGKPTSTRFSPLSVWAYGRKQKTEGGMDSGVVFKILRDRGIAMEADWPIKGKSEKYVHSLGESDVTEAVKKAALRHRMIDLKWYSGYDPKIIKQLFVQYGPPYVTTSVYGIVGKRIDCDMWNQKPGYILRGAHAMTGIGYNSQGILLRNSWGDTWCDGKGNVLLPWNEVKKVKRFSFWKDAPTTDCVNFESDTGYKCVGAKKASCASFPCKISDAWTCCMGIFKMVSSTIGEDAIHYTELVGPCRTADGGMGSFTKVAVSTSEECQKRCDESTSCIGYETHETVQTHCELHSEGTTTSDPSSTAGTCFLKDNGFQIVDTGKFCPHSAEIYRANDDVNTCRQLCADNLACLYFNTYENSNCDSCIHFSSCNTLSETTCSGTVTTYLKRMQSFDFELRGRNGVELIITDGEDKQTATLSTDYKAFSAHNKNIVITFKNDFGQHDVFFKSSVHTDIRIDGRFSRWNCGTSNENWSCQYVRDGKFLWSGDYQITFDDNKAGN